MNRKLVYFLLPLFTLVFIGAQTKKVQNGDLFDTSLFIANSIKLECPKVSAYARIALQLFRAGKKEEADKLFEQAIEISNAINEEKHKDSANNYISVE